MLTWMRVNVMGPSRSRAAILRALLVATAGVMVIALQPMRAAGQAGLTHADNAVPIPRGMLRLSATPSWARWDSRFTGDGSTTEPLGVVLTGEPLGTAQLPGFTQLESALRALTGDPAFQLSLGRSAAFSSLRVVTTPISLEYGLTRRFSLGVTVPIVQRQRELILDIAAIDTPTTWQRGVAGNVGPTRANVDASVYAQAARIASEIDAATLQLSQLVALCTATPGAAGCGAVNADPMGATATIQEGAQVAAGIRYVYGTSGDAPGVGLVPRTQFDQTISTRLQALDARFATYLGGTPIPTQTPPTGAAGAVASGDLRRLMSEGVAGMGPDSLGRISTIGIGDVEVGARFLLWDSRPRTIGDSISPEGFRLRATLGAVARFATGEPPNVNELFSVGAGDGQSDAEASLGLDIETGTRIGATIIGRYTAQLGTVATTRLPDARGSLTPFGASANGTRALGDIFTLEVSPRFWLASSLFIGAHYGMIVRGHDTYTFPSTPIEDAPILPSVAPLPEHATVAGYTEHRGGFSISYSTVADWERGRVRVPIEVSYTHLETFLGTSAMVPRAGRDQIQLRLYYRVRR